MSMPLVLIPGLTCTAELFAPQWAALARGRTIFIADHMRDETIVAIARRLLANAPPRFALCGLSMGGYIAFEVIRQAPERVTRLALLDTGAKGATPETNKPREQMISLAERGSYTEVTNLFWPRFVAPHRLDDLALRATVSRMAEETGPEIFIQQQRAIMSRADSRPSLGAISVPTLVLVGELDLATPVAESQEIADGIKGSRLTVLPNCGHLSTLESPEAVNAALMVWLNEEKLSS
jgi:pimeloyl-ACP methyl ester carboxylesterase